MAWLDFVIVYAIMSGMGTGRGTINGGVLGSGIGMEYKDNDIRNID